MLIWTTPNGISPLIDVNLTISGTRGTHFVYNKLLSKGEQNYVLVDVRLDILVWFKHILFMAEHDNCKDWAEHKGYSSFSPTLFSYSPLQWGDVCM